MRWPVAPFCPPAEASAPDTALGRGGICRGILHSKNKSPDLRGEETRRDSDRPSFHTRDQSQCFRQPYRPADDGHAVTFMGKRLSYQVRRHNWIRSAETEQRAQFIELVAGLSQRDRNRLKIRPQNLLQAIDRERIIDNDSCVTGLQHDQLGSCAFHCRSNRIAR